MATVTKETFDESFARIAAEPPDIEVSVKKIDIDLTLPGILARVKLLADEAHQQGELGDEHWRDIVDTSEKLTGAGTRLYPRRLLKGIPGWKGKR